MNSIIQFAFAQKPPIDTFACSAWPYFSDGTISTNGKYVLYNIKKATFPGIVIKSIIQSTAYNWKIEFYGGIKSDIKFTPENKFAVFIDHNEGLNIVSLEGSLVKLIPNVASFEINTGSEGWLAYQPTEESKSLVLLNLLTGIKKVYTGVITYDFSNNGKFILLKTILEKNSEKAEAIRWINLTTDSNQVIWEGRPISNLVFDDKNCQLSFVSDDSIWYYKDRMKKPVCLIERMNSVLDSNLELGSLNNFSKDGNRIFIALQTKTNSSPKKAAIEVWSYNDPSLLTEQELTTKYYTAVLNLSDHKIMRLQKENEDFALPVFEESSDTIGFIQQRPENGSHFESNWNSSSKVVNYLVSTKTGKRTMMKKGTGTSMSPKGKYLIHFNAEQQNYFSYEITTGISHNMTSGLNVSWISKDRDDYTIGGIERGVATWVKGDKFVLVYDRNDIWKLDPLAVDKPINLTNGYGLKNNIIFDLGLDYYSKNSISSNERLILNAFNTVNKNNGFYSKDVNRIGDPNLLTMGAYVYQLIGNSYVRDQYLYPIKARDTNVYLLRRMSAKESPNYFITRDFKSFKCLTDLHPEKNYNWYTTELHTWTSLDGRSLQGILYKPENFDVTKKYPVIFHYYERKSDGLNCYLRPELSSGSIDIATYVSNGYLVFSPDIYYTVGDPMQGTYDAVVSAARYIGALPFVNASRMGLQGHSFGAIQTNYLVTHTSLFAAACSASGLADFVSGYGTLYGNTITGYKYSLQHIYEVGQNRMGKSLWDSPEAYLKNSPVFNADKVSTSLLLMHTKKDVICPYSNILELFLALRRLGKRVWMLAYPEGIHSVHGEESEDFSFRMKQFFDYYLKDKPAPIWMLDGISSSDNKRKSLELDTTGRTPGPGLLTHAEQKKIENLMNRKPIIITQK